MGRSAVAIVFSFLMSGCAGWPVFKNCVSSQKVQDEQALGEAVIALASGQNYLADLMQLGAKVGLPTLDCAAKALYADVQGNKTLASLAAHLKSYLDARTSAGASLECNGPHLASAVR